MTAVPLLSFKRSYLASAPWLNETFFIIYFYKGFEPNVSSLWGQMGYMFKNDSGLALMKLSLIKLKDLNWLATEVKLSNN